MRAMSSGKAEFLGVGVVNAMSDYMQSIGTQLVSAKASLTELGFDRFPIFVEVKDPDLMTTAQIRTDGERSGVSPSARMQFWISMGYRPLDFNYVQPALNSGQNPVQYLRLLCSMNCVQSLPTGLLLAHLRSFIAISVLKGKNPCENADYKKNDESVTGSSFD